MVRHNNRMGCTGGDETTYFIIEPVIVLQGLYISSSDSQLESAT